MSWQDRAACRGVPLEVFFPEREGHHGHNVLAQAKRICAGCPVLAECREWAIHNDSQSGFMGGMTWYARRAERQRLRAQGTPIPPRAPLDPLRFAGLRLCSRCDKYRAESSWSSGRKGCRDCSRDLNREHKRQRRARQAVAA